MTSAPLIDLNASRRESQYPDGIPVALGDDTFTLPAELPAETFDPLLADDLDLLGLFKQVVAEKDKGGLKSDSFGEQVLEILMDRPTLPKQAITAIKDCFALLFGPEQYARFVAQRPSLADYVRLGRALFSIYGVSLGEAFASPDSSENAGETPKQTSPSTTESTPETPGAAPETPAS